MRLTIQKWGNDAAIQLPESVLEQLGAKIGDSVELKLNVQSSGFTLHKKPKYKLEDLLAEMPEGLPKVDGWDEMKPIGQEN